uniref:Uncharacterized protein n=1 Tax=Arundo donax TaxID=35708 RepID=A0A0A8YBL6_ARUDO
MDNVLLGTVFLLCVFKLPHRCPSACKTRRAATNASYLPVTKHL